MALLSASTAIDIDEGTNQQSTTNIICKQQDMHSVIYTSLNKDPQKYGIFGCHWREQPGKY